MPPPEGLLRPALQLALEVARAGAGSTPAVEPPRAVRPFVRFARLPEHALAAVRRAVDEDDEFRSRVVDAAEEVALGRAGWLFITRPEGWEEELAALLDDARIRSEAELQEREEKSARRRLAHAEQARERADEQAAAARASAARVAAELAEERRERRAAQDEATRLERRAATLEAERDSARRRAEQAAGEAQRARAEAEAALAEARARRVDPAAQGTGGYKEPAAGPTAPQTADTTPAAEPAAAQKAAGPPAATTLAAPQTAATTPAAEPAAPPTSVGEPGPATRAADPATEVASPVWARSTSEPAVLSEALAAAAAAAQALARALSEAAAVVAPSPTASPPPANGEGPAGDRAGHAPSKPAVRHPEEEGRPVGRVRRRRPVALPPAMFDDTAEAGAHLVRVPGAVVLVDGYNVAKALWPEVSPLELRERLVDALTELQARTGAEIHVVFDGADVGAHPPRPAGRRSVRVSFSPPEVEADDVILDEVDIVQPQRPVVVASSDRRVQDGARARGANVISSMQLAAVLGRS